MIHETKNDERRALPLTGAALKLLRDRSKIRRVDTDLIFANTRPCAVSQDSVGEGPQEG